MHAICRWLEVRIGPCDAQRPKVHEFHFRPVVLGLTRCRWLVGEFVGNVVVVYGELIPEREGTSVRQEWVAADGLTLTS